jgi:hypothetical protein
MVSLSSASSQQINGEKQIGGEAEEKFAGFSLMMIQMKIFCELHLDLESFMNS